MADGRVIDGCLCKISLLLLLLLLWKEDFNEIIMVINFRCRLSFLLLFVLDIWVTMNNSIIKKIELYLALCNWLMQ